MGQKVNPISVRLEQTNRHFESCWYSDYQYSHLLNEDLKVKSYINNILKQLGCSEGHISMIYMAKKIKILFCYLDGRSSTSLKSSHFYLKVVNKNNKKKENKRKRHFFKNRLAARYLLGIVGKRRSNKKILLSGEKQVSSKYDGTIPSVHDAGLFDACLPTIPEQASHSCIENRNPFHGHVKKTTLLGHSTRQVSRKEGLAFPFVMKKKDEDLSVPASKKKSPVSTRKEVASWRQHRNHETSRDGGLQNIKYKERYLEMDDTMLPSQCAPFSPLVMRKNPFRILLAFYKKRRKRKRKRVFNPFSLTSNQERRAEMRRRPLRQRKRVIQLADKGSDRQVSFWKYLTNASLLSLGEEQKNYYPFVKNGSLFDPCVENRSLFDPCVNQATLFDSFSAIWSYLVFNHKVFFNKVIQRKKGFQIWHKSLFIRYLLLFIYKERFSFFASPMNHYAATPRGGKGGTPMDRQDGQTKGEWSFSQLGANRHVKNTGKKGGINSRKSLCIPTNLSSLNAKDSKKMDFSRETDGIKVDNKDVNSTLLKYHMPLESINRIEWFQGRGMAFLWFLFNSVHPTQRIFNIGSVMSQGSKKLFFSQNKEGLKSLLSALQRGRESIKLYSFPYQITPSQRIILNDLEDGGSFNKIRLDQERKDGLPSSISFLPWNHASAGVRCKIKQRDDKKEGKREMVTDPSMPSQKRKQGALCLGRRPLRPRRPVYETEGLNLNKTRENYLRESEKDISLKMARKPLYPRTVKSKGFFSYIEYILSTQIKSSVRLSSWKTKDEQKSALFIIEQIVYFLQRRVPFHRIKQQIWRQLKLKSIQGIRIAYSGRLGGRSKKAQRSRRKTFQWGQASSHVFDSKMSFASKYALTIFGKIGIKVWVCYK